ncbi:ankyrin [Ophiobolus disseminans]|uniref:Ankyrin n=1 Tax=Ophiobolus disseminans TaxID=1469910 RepID=A0A6A6ZTL1_9PLEO|nr:ankyrin [Ophiobolus disseminans]
MNDNARLFQLIRRNDIDRAVHLLGHQSADADIVHSQWGSPLHMAASRNDLRLASALCELGAADVNIVCTTRHNIRDGGMHFTRYNTCQPLICAVELRWPDMVRFLIQEGANVDAEYTWWQFPDNVTDHDFDNVHPMDRKIDWTPLHAAAKAQDVEVIRILLESGADKTVRDHDGETPREVAFDTDADNYEIMDMLEIEDSSEEEEEYDDEEGVPTPERVPEYEPRHYAQARREFRQDGAGQEEKEEFTGEYSDEGEYMSGSDGGDGDEDMVYNM